MKLKHPVQPVYVDKQKILRFKENHIVRYMLDILTDKEMGLNNLARMNFSMEDWSQFNQLIGYSVGGFDEVTHSDNEYSRVIGTFPSKWKKIYKRQKMSICNYCSMQDIKRDAKKKDLKVVIIPSTCMDTMGGVEVHVLKKGEKPSKKNWRAWFMEVSQGCCC